MSTWTTVVQGYGQAATHLFVTDERLASPHRDEGHTLTTWLKMMNWPQTGCGVRWPTQPIAVCGRLVQSGHPFQFSLLAPDIPVTCEECARAELRYPMLTDAG